MMYEMPKCANNKDIEQYHCLFSEYKTAKTGLRKKRKWWNKSKETKYEKQKNAKSEERTQLKSGKPQTDKQQET